MLKLLIGKAAHVLACACDTTASATATACDCSVPQTQCPARCVGHLHLHLARGALAHATVVVRNVGKAARTFTFRATALAGASPGTAALQVSPESAELAPGQSCVVQVELERSTELQACQDYHAELLVEGAFEQCVKLSYHVRSDPFDSAIAQHGDSATERLLHGAVSKPSIDWRIQRGVAPQAALTIHNKAAEALRVELMVSPLIGVDGAEATIRLEPQALLIDPGESKTARLELDGSLALSPGRYSTNLRATGLTAPEIPLRCEVCPDPSAQFELEQGEPPTRVRAHHWYDHFQCTDACTPGT